MKLGILGTGKIVQEFLPWLVEHTPFTVQAVCSTPRSAAKAAELCAQYQIPQHTTNYFELLQWVDAVYIAVPNLQHARYARVALEAGKHTNMISTIKIQTETNAHLTFFMIFICFPL